MAHAAAAAGLRLTVYISENAPRTKWTRSGRRARSCVRARDYDEAERRAKEHGARGEAVFISPYAHPDVIAGAGTVGLEILKDDPAVEHDRRFGRRRRTASAALRSRRQASASRGCRNRGVHAFTQSLAAGRIVPIDVGETIADGLTGNLDPDTPTFDIVRQRVERIVVVDEEQTIAAVRNAFLEERLVVEGAAAVALAAVAAHRIELDGRRTVVVVSGANIDLRTWDLVTKDTKGTKATKVASSEV